MMSIVKEFPVLMELDCSSFTWTVDDDLQLGMEHSIDYNLERHTAKKETVNQRQILTKEVQNLKQEKNKQFLDLMGTIDKQREEMSRSTRTTTLHVSKLQEALDDRKSVVNSLTSKLHMTDAALALSQQKVQDLGVILTQTKRESSSMRELHAKELRKEKEVDELERKCKMQQEQLFDSKQELTNTNAELKLRAVQAEERLEAEKRRFRQTQDEASVLRQKEVAHMTRHMEDSERMAQERMQRLEATKLAVEEGRQSTPAPEPQREDQKRTSSYEDGRPRTGPRSPPDRTTRPGSPCNYGQQSITAHSDFPPREREYNVELSRIKLTLANERAQAEEEIQKARSAAQQEEENQLLIFKKCQPSWVESVIALSICQMNELQYQIEIEFLQQNAAILQDKIRTVTQSRDQAQNQVLQQKQQVGELQAQNNQLCLEIEGLKRRIDGLQQELSKKDQEKVSEVTKVRVELQEQMGHLEAELTAQEGLKEKISALERQQKGTTSENARLNVGYDAHIAIYYAGCAIYYAGCAIYYVDMHILEYPMR
ncbi:unnamed protein product [Ranitomeya imitator]|uniref:Uncharacterized protein n=1 Tax=Ranitomeya imitator TaxID=111125 RepID=A0ABN9M6C1_9NEOB|nr:unnamed protein product [Ranitomeya imitator]